MAWRKNTQQSSNNDGPTQGDIQRGEARGERIRGSRNADQAWDALFGGNPTRAERQVALDYIGACASERQAIQNARRHLRG